MIKVRKSDERGTFDHGWLKTRHTFSFDQYHDVRYHHFSDLRVINEDDIAPGQGFGTHGHRDMEILTYVLSGAVAHKDSLGNETRIPAGEIQVMSAGTGVQHSEFNPSPTEPLRLLQIWIFPNTKGAEPRYAQRALDPVSLKNKWSLLVAPDGEGALPIRQDARVYATRLDGGQSLTSPTAKGRNLWVQMIEGQIAVGGAQLDTGDGASLEGDGPWNFSAARPSHFLLFDLR